MSISVAAPDRPRVVPSFVVKKLEGTVERTLITFDKEGKRGEKLVKVDAGYLVSFPMKGHSIRINNAENLKRLGFDKTIPLVDTNSDNDDIVGYTPNSVEAA